MSRGINYDERFDLIETKRGQKVYLGYNFIMTRKNSSYVSYAHVKEALSNFKGLIEDHYFGTINMNRPVGKCACVEITDENRDKVQMLYRRGKSGKTPVIINGKMKQTQYITLGIQRDKKDKEKYHVFAAYYGPCSGNEPWDPRIKSEEQRKECEEFWSTHALCLAPTQIDWKRSNEQEDTV